MRALRRGGTSDPSEPWGRGRLLVILGGAATIVLLVAVGLGLFTWQLLTRGDSPTAAVDAPRADVVLADAGPDRREQLAALPMLEVSDPLASRDGEIAATVPESMQIPPATQAGPVGVPTGFPQTPEGAVAQLGAIDTTVLQGMSVSATHEVYRTWGTGGGAAEDWVMTQNVTAFLTGGQQGGQEKETGLLVTAVPVAGQVKGVDGDDWVLACVLLDVRAVLVEEGRMAYGHCEAMTWEGDRWVIDTDAQAAPAPSTWPGTDLAIDAGWLTWATDH